MKKMNFLLFVIIMLQNITQAQLRVTNFTAENLENKILTYQPIQREGITDEKFSRGKFILDKVKESAKKNNLQFIYPDYWNITMAFISLGEPKIHIEIAFQKAIDDNEKSICEYVDAFGDKAVNRLTEHIPELFLPFYSNCSTIETKEEKLDCKKYATENNLNLELVELLNQIGNDDQKFRKTKEVDWSKQTPLDKRNLELVDSLYQQYGSYIGKNLVGEKLESNMWAVIQHSNIESMEKYLPIIHQAVKEENIHPTPFTMLLDRIHCIKYNYQFFGSQFGGDCKLAEEEKRLAIKKKYELE